MSNLNLNTISSLDTGREVDVNRVMQTVDYAGGLVIDSRDTVIVDGDDRYVLAASAVLPYTTTGAGMPEGGAFVSVGGAVLAGVSALTTAPKKNTRVLFTNGFYGTEGEAVLAYSWNPSTPKNLADGGRIIDPEKLHHIGEQYNRDALIAYFEAQGTGEGLGCYHLVLSDIYKPSQFGIVAPSSYSVSDGQTELLNHFVKSVPNNSHVDFEGVMYAIGSSTEVDRSFVDLVNKEGLIVTDMHFYRIDGLQAGANRYGLLNLTQCVNITFENLLLDGNRDGAASFSGEWSHGLVLGDGCRGVRVIGGFSNNNGGDGVTITGDVNDFTSIPNLIHFENFITDNNYRQGLSLIKGSDITFQNCRFTNTNGTDPAAGVDIEPNVTSNPEDWGDILPVERVSFINCLVANNQGPSVMMASREMQARHIQFNNCDIVGGGSKALIGHCDNLIIENCRIANHNSLVLPPSSTNDLGVIEFSNSGIANQIVIRNCIIEDNASKRSIISGSNRNSMVVLENNVFRNNWGGINLYSEGAHISNNVFDTISYGGGWPDVTFDSSDLTLRVAMTPSDRKDNFRGAVISVVGNSFYNCPGGVSYTTTGGSAVFSHNSITDSFGQFPDTVLFTGTLDSSVFAVHNNSYTLTDKFYQVTGKTTPVYSIASGNNRGYVSVSNNVLMSDAVIADTTFNAVRNRGMYNGRMRNSGNIINGICREDVAQSGEVFLSAVAPVIETLAELPDTAVDGMYIYVKDVSAFKIYAGGSWV